MTITQKNTFLATKIVYFLSLIAICEKELKYIQNRTRNINISFRVDERERQAIYSQFARSGINSIGAYLRSAAMYCDVIKIDMKPMDNYSWQISAIGNNINQIAKRVNMGGNIKASDLEYLEKSMEEIKGITNKIYDRYMIDI